MKTVTSTYSRRHLFRTLSAILVSCAGCVETLREEAPSPLKPITPTPDSCMIDLFFVRFPVSHAEANSSLWDTIDEQLFTPDTRNQLKNHGFRIGVSGNRIPTELSQLLEIEGRPLLTITQRVKGEDLLESPHVIRAQQRLQPGRRQEIICSDVYPHWPLLRSCDGGVQGETLDLAQAILGVRSTPTSDGAIRIRILPEIHYGESRRRYTSRGGVMRLDEGRDRREFSELSMETILSPGQMLVLTCLPERENSMGWRFFTRNDRGTTEQRMLVIRLSQVQNHSLLQTEDPAETFGVGMFHIPPADSTTDSEESDRPGEPAAERSSEPERSDVSPETSETEKKASGKSARRKPGFPFRNRRNTDIAPADEPADENDS
ncbi:MAG: hypothetical protein Q4C47_08015 [Planctomycetia bacterium]|nr:hypothetical protein [Planctomycetia bacterium]